MNLPLPALLPQAGVSLLVYGRGLAGRSQEIAAQESLADTCLGKHSEQKELSLSSELTSLGSSGRFANDWGERGRRRERADKDGSTLSASGDRIGSFSWALGVGLTLVGVLLLVLPLSIRDRPWQILLTVVWGVFMVVWFGVGLTQIADGLL